MMKIETGATSGTRTHDLPLTMGMLYQLSYGGKSDFWKTTNFIVRKIYFLVTYTV